MIELMIPMTKLILMKLLFLPSSSSSMKSVDSSLEHFTDIYWYFHKVTGNAKKHMMPYIQG